QITPLLPYTSLFRSIPACFHGFLTHKGMLEICCADNNRIDVLSVIEFLVVPGSSNGIAGLFFKIGHCFIPPSVPDIRNCRKLKRSEEHTSELQSREN